MRRPLPSTTGTGGPEFRAALTREVQAGAALVSAKVDQLLQRVFVLLDADMNGVVTSVEAEKALVGACVGAWRTAHQPQVAFRRR
jgi:hypothetical protein